MFIRPTKRTCHSKLQTSQSLDNSLSFDKATLLDAETTRNMRVQNGRGIAASYDESFIFSPNYIDKFVDPTYGEHLLGNSLGHSPNNPFFHGKIPICWQRTFDREAERIFILIIRPSICSSTEVKSKYPLY